MPTPAYLTVEGEVQKKITDSAFTEKSVGNIYQEGHENEILVQEFRHELQVPVDPQSGQPSGSRVHKPMTITKVFDKSSPLLYQALVTGEKLIKCELKWYRTSTTGTQEHYFTMALEDAIITGIEAFMPNCQDPSQSHFTHLEKVSFSYRKISWDHIAAGTSGEDDWRKPVVA
jgi:type VI secretion system secreted protein Hcp